MKNLGEIKVILLLKEGNLEGIKELVPESIYKIFKSDEGK